MPNKDRETNSAERSLAAALAVLHAAGAREVERLANAGRRWSLVAEANQVGRNDRGLVPAPVLSASSSVAQVEAWLQWCDPNGCHTAELAEAEGCQPYDEQSVWDALAGMLKGWD